MPEAVIIDAIRTPIGALGGSLAAVRPDDLAALVLQALVERTGIDPALVEEVYLGCANQAGEDNRNVARMALLLAGFPVQVAGVTVNRLCASGLAAVNRPRAPSGPAKGRSTSPAAWRVMSRAPYSLPKAEQPFAFGNLTAWDTALGWRYPNPKMQELYGTESMGETAENIAEQKPHLTREMQDAFRRRESPAGHCRHRFRQVRRGDRPGPRAAEQGRPGHGHGRRAPARDTSLESLAASSRPSARTARSRPAIPPV